jgi:hypothetical protein
MSGSELIHARTHIQVDSKTVSNLSLRQTLDLIKGQEDSTVDLLIARQGNIEEKLIRLTRKSMQASPSVSSGDLSNEVESHGRTDRQSSATWMTAKESGQRPDSFERHAHSTPFSTECVFVTYETGKSVVTVDAPKSPPTSNIPPIRTQKRGLFSRLFNFGKSPVSESKKEKYGCMGKGALGLMGQGATRESAVLKEGDGKEAETWGKLGIVTKPIACNSNANKTRHTVTLIERGAEAHGGIIRYVLSLCPLV